MEFTYYLTNAGTGTNADELLAIGGKAANVFEVADYDQLKGKPEIKTLVAVPIGCENRRIIYLECTCRSKDRYPTE